MPRIFYGTIGLLAFCSCVADGKKTVPGRYKSKPTSDLVIGFRQLFAHSTVTGTVLQLVADGHYVRTTCGGTSGGNYTITGKQVSLYQCYSVSHRQPADTMMIPDTTTYRIRNDGSLINQFSSYYFYRGQRKSITSVDHLVRAD